MKKLVFHIEDDESDDKVIELIKMLYPNARIYVDKQEEAAPRGFRKICTNCFSRLTGKNKNRP